MKKEYIISSIDEMHNFGRQFAHELSVPTTVLLYGNLGVGKTELTRSIISELSGAETTVPSPTFTLVQTYDTNIGTVNHFDLYRIKDESELEEIGLFDAMQNSITIIEWPELARPFINPAHTIVLEIVSKPNGQRIITKN